MAESDRRDGPNWIAIGAVALAGTAAILAISSYSRRASRVPRLSKEEEEFARRMFERSEAAERRNEAIQRERRVKKGGLRPAFYSKSEELDPMQRTAMRRILRVLDEEAEKDAEANKTRVPTGDTSRARRR